jgi:DNA-binding CsgD family transcriptional regulator
LLELAGLTAEEESVYLALLELPPVTIGDACQAYGSLNRAELRVVLDVLTDKGLLTQVSQRPRRYAPVAPETALEVHLRQREEELRRARAGLASLSERYRVVPRQSGTGDLTEILTGKRHILQYWLTSLGSATNQVRMLSGPPLEADSPDPDPAELEVLGRGVPVRVVYDEAGMCNPAALTRRRTGVAAGEQARVAGQVPVHLLLVDDRLALMPLGQGRLCGGGMLAVRQDALLDALSALFEIVWDNALPFTLDASTRLDGRPLVLHNNTTRTVLGLLSAGLTDQAIARRLGCSERTVQRHVLRLTEAVGARTRFQTALHIGHRKWTT